MVLALSGCSPAEPSGVAVTDQLQPIIDSIEVFGPSAPVAAGTSVDIATQTQPLAIGVDMELQYFADGEWVVLGSATTDQSGEALFSLDTPEIVGEVPFRAVATASDSSTLAVSQAVDFTLTERSTDDVSIMWPVQPMDYCASSKVVVQAGSESAGRDVSLLVRGDSIKATPVDQGRFDVRGEATLRIPECEDSTEVNGTTQEWAIRIPDSGIYSAFTSPWTSLEVGPPPITCPGPQPIPMFADNPDVGRSYFTVSNPSEVCQAEFTVTGDFFCVAGLAGDGYVLGGRTSSSYFIPPGGSVTYLTDDVFTDSAASCRADVPGGGLEFNLGTYRAQAVSFTPV